MDRVGIVAGHGVHFGAGRRILLAEVIDPWSKAGRVRRAVPQAGIERFQDQPGITLDGNGRGGFRQFIAIQIDHRHSHVLGPARRLEMANDEVRARAERQHKIGLTKGQGARAEQGEGVILGNYPATLRCGVEGNTSQIDEGFHRGTGAGPDDAATTDDQRALRGGQSREDGVDISQ